jgi:hypothetical protein
MALTQATEAQQAIIGGVILDVFGTDVENFRASLEAIKVNTDRVTIENQIEKLREQQRAYNEQIEAQIQELLGLK